MSSLHRQVLRTLCFAAAFATGCATSERNLQAAPDAPYAEDEIGSASLQLTSVPTGVQCLSVTTSTSNSSSAQALALTAGASSTSLNLGRLPLGQVSFSALAYDQACSGIAGQTPTWIADAVSTRLEPGVIASVTLTLRRNNPVQASATFVDNIVSIWPGGNGVVALTQEGSAYLWGSMIGMPTGPSSPFSISTGLLSNISAVRAVLNNTCTLDTSGVARCMGTNSYGQLGTGSTSTGVTSVPGEVFSSAGVVSLAVGDGFVCITTGGGTVRCAGRNNYGQLGINSTVDSPTVTSANPSPSTTLFSRIHAGAAHVCGVTRDATVYCWGRNSNGQLGVGDTAQRNVPTLVPNEAPVVELALSHYNSCSRRVDGSVRCWGYNYYGNVGDGTTVDKTSPTLITLPGRARQISAFQGGTCALLESGSVRCWGENTEGAVGDETRTHRSSPVAVVGLPSQVDALAQSSSGETMCAFDVGGNAWCWGDNTSGNVGDGTRENRFRATLVKL